MPPETLSDLGIISLLPVALANREDQTMEEQPHSTLNQLDSTDQSGPLGSLNSLGQRRARAGLRNLFVADALAMPVHWYYNPMDIERQFPGGISQFEAAPEFHPSSIMSLHSTSQGGRSSAARGNSHGKPRKIVGEVILKGREKFWGVANTHYHHGMQAGSNTLNAHCTRALLRTLAVRQGIYDREAFLDAYIELMTADPALHPDTYAESYHRGFFANLEAGNAPHRCAAVTHDTPSIGGLVSIAAIYLAGRLAGQSIDALQQQCVDHLYLTHPDEVLAGVCVHYTALLEALLTRDDSTSVRELLVTTSRLSANFRVAELAAKAKDDREVIGGLFSSACYIDGAWPGLLYLAYKYVDQPEVALLANADLGGDNCHRGAVLGILLGVASAVSVDTLYNALLDREQIDLEIDAALGIE
ncbi:ADP-ribosylglycohydrolase family protein [Gammaproteobacteria bacterium]|nr:ADP-ribosylglycohydrolase family protein [Gammaproteobacteria bacterium]